MIEHIRTRALWLAAGLVLGGGAFAFAGAAGEGPTNKPSTPAVSQQETPDEDANESADAVESQGNGQAGERKQNHGFFVSQAAHCEDVNDEANGITFTAPDDCETSGKAHGEYVSGVAKSKAGKAPKDHPTGPEE